MICSRTDGPRFLRSALLFLGAFLYLNGECREDPIELIRRHRYEEAVSVWDKDISSGKLDEKGLRALKGKSLAYFRLGSLFNAFSSLSSPIMTSYYSEQTGESGNAQNYLYLGQIQFQAGLFVEAKNALEKSKKLGNAGTSTSDMTEVFLHFTRKRLGESNLELAEGIKDISAQWEALELQNQSTTEVPASLKAETQRSRRCRLKIMLHSASSTFESVDNSLQAVLKDAQQPEAYLDQGKNTQINFYDPFLMETISDAYFTLSKLTNLRIKEEEGKFPDLAAKFNTQTALAESYARLGQWKEALNSLGQSTDLETQILKAQIFANQNRIPEARSILQSISISSKSPADQRDIADCYYLLHLDLDKGLKLAGQAVRERNSANYYRSFANLLFVNGQTEAAMQQYAKGYKIEYRNRIDQIDPEYMCDYSLAIFKTNKLRYEEIVETLYHLQKEFPACRQMHYCMQGISAGLARSYESQRIFRKGG